MKAYSYSDIIIPPQYSNVRHRSKVKLDTTLAGLKLTLPLISANMKDVTGVKMVNAMYEHGGLGILHRFWNIHNNIMAFKECCKTVPVEYVGVSVGGRPEEIDRFDKLYKAGARTFAIDIAHGHSIMVKEILRHIMRKRKTIRVIAGNVATPEAAKDLLFWGADVIKIGIGSGSMCITRKNTGIGVPQFYAIEQIRDAVPNAQLIADGGVRNICDIAKALMRTDAVMVGAVLAGTSETPGKVYADNNIDLIFRTFYKLYGGSSSAEIKGENSFVEGKIKMIPFKGHVKYILKDVRQGLQSSFSYIGAKNLKQFQSKATYIEQDLGGKMESET